MYLSTQSPPGILFVAGGRTLRRLTLRVQIKGKLWDLLSHLFSFSVLSPSYEPCG